MVEDFNDDADFDNDEIGDGETGEIIEISGGGGTDKVPLLPMPVRLEQKRTTRSLTAAVKGYFYPAYNSNPQFRRHLQSVGNNDSVTKNRLFDRHIAAMVIREMAERAKDPMTAGAPAGHIYQCLVNIMRNENMGLRLRRQQYRQLTHQAAAD